MPNPSKRKPDPEAAKILDRILEEARAAGLKAPKDVDALEQGGGSPRRSKSDPSDGMDVSRALVKKKRKKPSP